MTDDNVFRYPEDITGKDYIIATYYMSTDGNTDILKKAASLAVGQTIGTWLPIPGITSKIREDNMGKVLQVFDIPSMDLQEEALEGKRHYTMRIAYPTINFTFDFPLLLTSLLGNDASTSAQVKLLDIEFPQRFAGGLGGPRYGSAGFRELSGVKQGPLLLNMIKPCTGLTPQEGAEIFYEIALGGVDFIKDDELFGSPSYSTAWDRVKAYNEAGRRAYEQTGKKVTYIVNVTDGAATILDTVKRVQEAGAEAIMLNFAAVGYTVLQQIAEIAGMPILAHSAGAGMFFEGQDSGMSSPLAVGKLARLAGADAVMINTPYGGYPLQYQKYIQTALQLTMPLYGVKASMPSIGGGVHPGMVKRYIDEVGSDIILAAGGSIIGHPMGAAAGARAMRQAMDAVMEQEDIKEAAKASKELKAALALWGEG